MISSFAKTIIIGDVHGCLVELKQLLAACEYKHGADRLLFCGDLIHRGPHSAEVWNFFLELQAQSVLGNHEYGHLIHQQGKLLNNPDILGFKQDLGKNYPAFLEHIHRLPLYIEEKDFLLVHAGLVPNKPLTAQSADELTKIRLYKNRPWFEYYKDPKLVVFGHWAVLGGLERSNLVGLDRGCVHGHQLAALVLPEKKIVWVPAQKAHYPIQENLKNNSA